MIAISHEQEKLQGETWRENISSKQFFLKNIYLIIISLFMQVKANKRYAGSSKWTVKVQSILLLLHDLKRCDIAGVL